jgi:hypothetical protein
MRDARLFVELTKAPLGYTTVTYGDGGVTYGEVIWSFH